MPQQTMADLMSQIGRLPAWVMRVVVDDQPAIPCEKVAAENTSGAERVK